MNEKTFKKQLSSTAAATIIALAAAILFSCSDTGTAPTSNDKDDIVVQAYLYAGQPVNDIRLTHLTKIISYKDTFTVNRLNGDTIQTIDTIVRDSFINNATVTISSGSTSTRLASQDSGWYTDTSGKLSVVVGQTYRIDVNANGRKAWAQTTVPSPVGGLSVSRDTLYIAQRSFGGGRGGTGGTTTTLPDSLTKLTVKWNNPNSAYLYCQCILDTTTTRRLQTRNGNYTAADSMKFSSGFSGGGRTGFQTRGDTTTVGLMQAGLYKVVIYTTTPDYRSMLNSMADTASQDMWSESPTNIQGGLGFFTSFSMDSVFFRIATASSN